MIALYILAWLLCGFAGSTALFYSPWGREVFYNTRQVTICQAFCRSLWGPIQIVMLVFCAASALVDMVFNAARDSKGCTQIIFKRKSK